MTTERQPKTLRDLAVAFEGHMETNHDEFWNADWDNWDSDTERIDALTLEVSALKQEVAELRKMVGFLRHNYNEHVTFGRHDRADRIVADLTPSLELEIDDF